MKMKKVLLVVLVFCTVLSFAQKLLIHPSDTIKETLIIKPGLVSEASTYVLNNTNAQINLKWKFVTYTGTNGYEFSMCDIYNCYAAGPQVREVDLAVGDSTFMKFGVSTNCVGGNAYGELLMWIDGDSTASVRSLFYIINLDNSDCATTIEDFEKNKFTTFPNPVADNLNLKFESQDFLREVIVTDISGKVIANFAAHAILNTINVASLNTGNYFLFIKSANTISERKKIVKF